MTELFETGLRILAHGRRLFAPPPLAEMPAAYASLLRDPSERLEELWEGAIYVDKIEERTSPMRFMSRDGRAPFAQTGGGVAADGSHEAASPSWLLNTPANVAQANAPASKPLSKNAPPRLSESRPTPHAPGGEVRALSPSSKGAAPNIPRPELPRGAAAPDEVSEPLPQRPAESEFAPNVVEWPEARPALVRGAELAAPGNVLQEREEELASDPELLRLREQLEVEEGKRRRRQEWPREVSGGGPEVSRPYAESSQVPAAQTATSFTPVAQLLTKNVARNRTDATAADLGAGVTADLAPREPEVFRNADTSPAPRRGADEGRSDGEGRAATAPLVEEVLEELYERLKLEFSRTYGTTGG